MTLPRGWVATTLGTVTAPSGRRMTADPSDDGPYLSMEHVESGLNRIVDRGRAGDMRSAGMAFQPGDTLYGRLRPYLNKVCSPDFRGLASAEFMVFPPRCSLAPRFLMYFLTQPDFVAFASLVNDGDRPRVKWPQIESYPLPLPPLPEQHRIVEAIEEQCSRLDAGVASLRRARRNLARMRASILAAAVESRLVEPEGEWATVTVGDLLAEGPQNGLYKPASDYGDGTPILRIDDFQNGWVRPRDDLRKVRVSDAESSSYALIVGDFVINRVNSMSHLGKCLVVGQPLAGALFESNMMRMSFGAGVLPRWMEIAIQSPSGRGALVENAKWAVNQASINQQDVRRTSLPLPSLPEQQRIVEEVDRQFSILDAMEATIDAGLVRADRLRQAILREAFAGRLVPQDPADEPASALLDRIAAGRTDS